MVISQTEQEAERERRRGEIREQSSRLPWKRSMASRTIRALEKLKGKTWTRPLHPRQTESTPSISSDTHTHLNNTVLISFLAIFV